MSRGIIYLAGSINPDLELFCREWRNSATLYLEEKGFEIINPIKDKDLTKNYNYEDIVNQDLYNVSNSDLVLAEMTWKDYPYVGTSIELYHAYLHGIPTIVWADKNYDEKKDKNYFMKFFATEIYSNLPFALWFINSKFEIMKE